MQKKCKIIKWNFMKTETITIVENTHMTVDTMMTHDMTNPLKQMYGCSSSNVRRNSYTGVVAPSLTIGGGNGSGDGGRSLMRLPL